MQESNSIGLTWTVVYIDVCAKVLGVVERRAADKTPERVSGK